MHGSSPAADHTFVGLQLSTSGHRVGRAPPTHGAFLPTAVSWKVAGWGGFGLIDT